MEIVTPLKNIDSMEKDTVTFTCELSKPDRTDGVWLFNNEEINLSARIQLKSDGYTQSLTITEVTLSDMGDYKYSIENISTSATLQVGGKYLPKLRILPAEKWLDMLFLLPELPVEFITPLGDYTVVEKQSITLKCQVSKPDKKPQWLKAGNVIEPSDKYEMHSEGTEHTLTIKNCTMDDESKYTIRFDEAESTGNLLVEGRFCMIIFGTSDEGGSHSCRFE